MFTQTQAQRVILIHSYIVQIYLHDPGILQACLAIWYFQIAKYQHFLVFFLWIYLIYALFGVAAFETLCFVVARHLTRLLSIDTATGCLSSTAAVITEAIWRSKQGQAALTVYCLRTWEASWSVFTVENGPAVQPTRDDLTHKVMKRDLDLPSNSTCEQFFVLTALALGGNSVSGCLKILEELAWKIF